MKKLWEVKPIIILVLAIFLYITVVNNKNDLPEDSNIAIEEVKKASIDLEIPALPTTEVKSIEEPTPPITDPIQGLFDKFEVPYEYQDYIRQLCEIYNVPCDLAVSVAQIETHNGHLKNYNVKSEERMYYTNGEATWDLGYFQMSTAYSDYWEESFFNPELIFSLGYVRNNFDLTDDIISIQIGISYLDWLLKYYYGNQKKAVMAYNAGLGNINKGRIPDRTVQYTKAVLNNYKYLEGDI